MRNLTSVGAMALVVGFGADAAETHSAHEHGHAVLRLAKDGAAVVIHFESPMESIVGFEHEPENDEQRAALKEAMRLVAVSENIVRLPSGCRSTGGTEVDIPHVAEHHGDEHHAAGEESEAVHDDHHAETGDDHDSEEEGEMHADLKATFNFSCESGPEWLEVTAFATFDGLEEVELQAVGDDAAIVETLTATSPRAALTGF